MCEMQFHQRGVLLRQFHFMRLAGLREVTVSVVEILTYSVYNIVVGMVTLGNIVLRAGFEPTPLTILGLVC